MMKLTKTLFGIVPIVVSLGMTTTVNAQDEDLKQSIEATMTEQEMQVKQALEKQIKQSLQQSVQHFTLAIKGENKKVLVANHQLANQSAYNLTNSED